MATRYFNIFVEGTDDHDLVLVLVKQLRATAPHPTIKTTREGQRVTTYLLVTGSDDILIIFSVGGWEKLGAAHEFLIRQARDGGGKTLIVFDADAAPTQRAQELKQRIVAYDPSPAIFLLPDSN